MKKATRQIPMELCQICYEVTGRYIFSCFCLICERCFNKTKNKPSNGFCPFCGKQTDGNVMDTRNTSQVKKIGYLFEQTEVSLKRVLEVLRFQKETEKKYINHVEDELQEYKEAVQELVSVNPPLRKYFQSRLNKPGSRTQSTQELPRNYTTNTRDIETMRQMEKPKKALSKFSSWESVSNKSNFNYSAPEQEVGLEQKREKYQKLQKRSHNVPSRNLVTALKTSERQKSLKKEKRRFKEVKQGEEEYFYKKYGRRF